MDHNPTEQMAFSYLAKWIQRWFYPLALVVTLIYVIAEANHYFGPPGSAYGWYLGLLIALLVLLERLVPIRNEWNMTVRSFLIRDLPMLLINGSTVFFTGMALVWLAENINGLPFTQPDFPWWIQAVIALALADFCWYWVHRYCHEAKGVLGRWMWRTHSLHHLPEEVYIFMHVAGHPIQAATVRIFLMLPPILLGFSPEAIFAAAALNGLQGLVSHFNVDSRAGWINNVLMGTELHRYHHSADLAEAGNYAGFFSLFDRLFGTYSLPGTAPAKLGVHDREAYPANSNWLGLMAFPFTTTHKAESGSGMK